jgi:hypothetical protein
MELSVRQPKEGAIASQSRHPHAGRSSRSTSRSSAAVAITSLSSSACKFAPQMSESLDVVHPLDRRRRRSSSAACSPSCTTTIAAAPAAPSKAPLRKVSRWSPATSPWSVPVISTASEFESILVAGTVSVHTTVLGSARSGGIVHSYMLARVMP